MPGHHRLLLLLEIPWEKTPLLLVVFFTFIIRLEVCMMLLSSKKSALAEQIICFEGIGLFIWPGYWWIFGYEAAKLTEGNPILRRQMVLLSDCSQFLTTFLSNIIIGFMVEQGKTYPMKILNCSSCSWFVTQSCSSCPTHLYCLLFSQITVASTHQE